VRVVKGLPSVWLDANRYGFYNSIILADGRRRRLRIWTPYVIEVMEVLEGEVSRDEEGHAIVLVGGGTMRFVGQCDEVKPTGPRCAPAECIPLGGECPADTVPRRADDGGGLLGEDAVYRRCTDCSGPVVEHCCFPDFPDATFLKQHGYPSSGFSTEALLEVDLTALPLLPPDLGSATIYRRTHDLRASRRLDGSDTTCPPPERD
jgi:hypothetical protein